MSSLKKAYGFNFHTPKQVKKVKWLENFALPISMLGAMALSILYANLLPAELLPAGLWS